jgi:L-rhamnose mutarotase
VRTYSIYISGHTIFSHMEVDDYDALVRRFNESPVAERWEEEFSKLIEYPETDAETGWPKRLQEVWSL